MAERENGDMGFSESDRRIFRDLAGQVMEIAALLLAEKRGQGPLLHSTVGFSRRHAHPM